MSTHPTDPSSEGAAAALCEGIAAAKAGQRDRARELLTRVVEQDEKNVLAWLWLSGAVDNLDEREICLENVLTLEPDNAAARKGLDRTRQQKADRMLRDGVAAAKAGQRARARELLMGVVERDERNAAAWLWLSGVVDDLDERGICLENVLALDPENVAARKGLERVREQKQPQPMISAEMVETFFGPDVGPPAESFSDGLDDEYLCPYCAAPTEHVDKKCLTCGKDLWISYRRREGRSTTLWIALALQIYNTFWTALPPLILSFFAFGALGDGLGPFLDAYADVFGEADAQGIWVTIAFAATLLPFLFSLGVLLGLYFRWKPVFYLLVIDAGLGLLLTVANVILSLSLQAAPVSLFACGGMNLLAAAARLFLAFQLEDDFAFERQRILLRADRDVKSVPMLLARGHEYIKRKAYALAALHLRRAVAMSPDRTDGRAALTLTYLKLKRHDAARWALDEARRADPDAPQIAELQALLDEARSAEDTSGSAQAV
jgi:tetratricopeptide (TPR) repeat protein